MIPEADASTLYDLGYECAADKNYVYRYGNIDNNIDAGTICILSPDYFKDRENIWYRGKRVHAYPAPDVPGFRLLNHLYAADNHTVYMEGIPVIQKHGAKPGKIKVYGEFIIINGKTYQYNCPIRIHLKTFRKIAPQYAVDKNAVYYLDYRFYSKGIYTPLRGAKPQTFRPPEK
ncbi:MAG: DKNYY domain-containing protein [Tannerellaceae bacterium]|nr:DKNYY domain-containing protein [Tannerellaceae bacterium]